MKVLSTFSSAMILNDTTSLKNIEALGRKTVFLHQMAASLTSLRYTFMSKNARSGENVESGDFGWRKCK